MLSSLIVKNVDTANVLLSAGIITSMVSALKSGSEIELTKSRSSSSIHNSSSFHLVYSKGQPSLLDIE